MSDIPWTADLSAVLILGIGGPLLGLLGLMECRSSRWHFGALVSGCLACVAGGIGLAGQPFAIWLSAALLAAADLLPRVIRRYHGRIAQLLRVGLHARRLQAAALLAAGPLLALGWSYYADKSREVPSFQPQTDYQDPDMVALRPARAAATTDRGRPVQLLRGPAEDQLDDMLRRREDEIGRAMALHLIRTCAPDPASNCHGWVFTGGQYCLRGADVAELLDDNGYAEVSQPLPGDVVVYRDDRGHILHTGLVRCADEKLVLIESKWGVGGRYLHEPSEQPYSAAWTYYRSARPNHLILGTQPATPIVPVAVSPAA